MSKLPEPSAAPTAAPTAAPPLEQSAEPGVAPVASAGTAAVVCKDVCKDYYLYQHRTTSLREFFIRTIKRQPIHTGHATFTLKNLNMQIEAGQVVGLIGRNGSGKSTALRLIGGIYRPTSGIIETFGRVGAVFELGTGFSPELTGSENIALKGVIMGLTSAEIAAQRDAIVEFSELGDFIDTPIKYYSSGMVGRLAFAVAFCVKPDILLLDEVLSVGDEAFQKKCIRRLQDFCSGGGTMLIASHNAFMLKKLCTRAIWLDAGELRLDGSVDEVLEAYQASQMAPVAAAKAAAG